jgi:putative redox protein
MTTSIIYKGSLRCEATHIQSGTIIETDAPTDNRGKGERFSPTDLVCVSLATCIVTTMGMKAIDMNIDLSNTKLEVTKHMATDPVRRIGKIEIKLFLPTTLKLDEKEMTIMQRVAETCPVKKSLHESVEVVVEFC